MFSARTAGQMAPQEDFWLFSGFYWFFGFITGTYPLLIPLNMTSFRLDNDLISPDFSNIAVFVSYRLSVPKPPRFPPLHLRTATSPVFSSLPLPRLDRLSVDSTTTTTPPWHISPVWIPGTPLNTRNFLLSTHRTCDPFFFPYLRKGSCTWYGARVWT